jgi:hypothetical protein
VPWDGTRALYASPNGYCEYTRCLWRAPPLDTRPDWTMVPRELRGLAKVLARKVRQSSQTDEGG